MRVNRMWCLCAAMMASLAPNAMAGRTDANKKTELRIVTKQIEPGVEYQFSRNVGPGRVLKFQSGVPGKVTSTYSVTLVNGKPVSKSLVAQVTTPAKPTIMYMGPQGYRPSRSAFGRARVVEMEATGYDASPRTIPGGTGRTATGMKAVYGCVAVDPRVIPLGTHLFVEGYGFAIASDTGSAIKGNRIDLCFNSRSQALNFGRRSVRVHVLRGGR